MLATCLKKWIDGTVFVAVEHTGLLQNNRLSYLVVQNNKSNLSTIGNGEVKSIKNLHENIPKNKGISIVINNELVLNKTFSTPIPEKEALSSAFPTLKLSDFYYEIIQNKEITTVSICRKKDVDSILNAYKKNNLHVLSFSLGNNLILQLERYIENDSLVTSNATVVFENNQVSEIKLNTFTEKTSYSINDLELLNTELLPLSSILSMLDDSNKTINNFEALISEKKNQYRQQRFFQKGVQVGLGLLFVLLILNMLLFTSYQNKISQWEQENLSNQQAKVNLQVIEKEVVAQKKLIKETLQSSSTHTTYILDDLTSILPLSLSLNSIQYQPIQKKIKLNSEIIIQRQELWVSGTTVSDIDFTNWIKDLEQRNWIDSVVIFEYGTDKNSTDFKIKIQIKDEWKVKK